MLRLRRIRSPEVAIALICLGALAALFVFQLNAIRARIGDRPAAAEQLLAKYEPLRRILPADESVRFEIDEGHTDTHWMSYGGRLYLAQYAASPRLVAAWLEPRWMLIDSDSPTAAPPSALTDGWTQVVHLGNGLRLYRTDWKAPQ